MEAVFGHWTQAGNTLLPTRRNNGLISKRKGGVLGEFTRTAWRPLSLPRPGQGRAQPPQASAVQAPSPLHCPSHGGGKRWSRDLTPQEPTPQGLHLASSLWPEHPGSGDDPGKAHNQPKGKEAWRPTTLFPSEMKSIFGGQGPGSYFLFQFYFWEDDKLGL